jgi:hypothetical protein
MKNLAIKKLIGFTSIGLIMFGCANNVKEEVKPAPLPKPNPVDTTSKDTSVVVIVKVKYSEVSSVLESACYGCHSGGSGGATFGDYSTLNNYLKKDSTKFINSITHAPGAKNMPDGGEKLPSDKILKILAWIRQGINP